MTDRLKLPPYGRRWLTERPSAGLVVCVGPHAWDFAKSRRHACLVLPDGDRASAYRWPYHTYGALVHETGPADDELLTEVALELLIAGNPFVVALRASLMQADPRVFFYPDKAND